MLDPVINRLSRQLAISTLEHASVRDCVMRAAGEEEPLKIVAVLSELLPAGMTNEIVKAINEQVASIIQSAFAVAIREAKTLQQKMELNTHVPDHQKTT